MRSCSRSRHVHFVVPSAQDGRLKCATARRALRNWSAGAAKMAQLRTRAASTYFSTRAVSIRKRGTSRPGLSRTHSSFAISTQKEARARLSGLVFGTTQHTCAHMHTTHSPPTSTRGARLYVHNALLLFYNARRCRTTTKDTRCARRASSRHASSADFCKCTRRCRCCFCCRTGRNHSRPQALPLPVGSFCAKPASMRRACAASCIYNAKRNRSARRPVASV